MNNYNEQAAGVYRVIRQTDYQYTIVPNKAVRDPAMTSNAFRLLVYLLSHENGYQLYFEQIMRQTDLGKYAIQKALQLLRERGFLETRRARNDDGSLGGYNFILLDPYSDGDATRAGHSTMEPVHHGPISPQEEDKSVKKITNKDISPKGFEDFWDAYPRKVAKGDARKAYAKALEKTDEQTLIKKARAYANQPDRKDEFTKYPASWLNAESWLDDYGPDYEAIREDKRRRELEYTRKLIQENDIPKGQVPKCEHGNNPALCKQCLKSIN